MNSRDLKSHVTRILQKKTRKERRMICINDNSQEKFNVL
jgi:hypothetical protein